MLVTLTDGDVKTVVGLPVLGEGFMEVCIGGLTSVTVGTVFTEGWDEITDEVTTFCAFKVARIIVLGAPGRPAALGLLTETGPLLRSVTAPGCELLLSAGPPAVI